MEKIKFQSEDGIIEFFVEEQTTVAGITYLLVSDSQDDEANAIKCLKRVSTPGLRKYAGYKEMPRVINGLGIAILSTSKGVMTNKEAADLKIGGEVLCYVY